MKHTMINYSMLTEIYHYLQARSKCYPWIDNYTFRTHFIEKCDILGEGSNFNMNKFNVLMTKATYNERFDEKLDKKWVDPPRGISRFMFMELMFRISKFMYSSEELQTKNEVRLMYLNENSTETVAVSQAFYMFINEKLKPYVER